jgi:alkylation response protein AidB-like acyl-CoA dehydrogenase
MNEAVVHSRNKGEAPMSLISNPDPRPKAATDWSRLMHELGPGFAERARAHDANDSFVAENFAELKAREVFAAGVPKQLGGGGASYPELCGMLRTLASYCGSTALALSMHTHVVAAAAWRWRRDPESSVRLLRRIADENLFVVTSGGSDWLTASGTAERVEGGWKINARKVFASGVPAGDLLMTQAIYDDPEKGKTVLHFAIPVRGPGVVPQDSWYVLGMRGTGSQDVMIKDVFVPESGILLRRPAGKFSAPFHLSPGMIPLPLVYAVYLGVAEAAYDIALATARKRPGDDGLAYLIGEMQNDLASARMAHRDMVEAADLGEPGRETTNRIWTGRTLVGRAAMRVVEKAMEVAGSGSFYRTSTLERLFRDIQGVRYHRPQQQEQLRFSGRLGLGFDVDE